MDRETSVTAHRFAAELEKNMNLDRVVLFGSRARGDHFVTSDYDFVVISEDFAGLPFTRRAATLHQWWDSDRDLEALCYTPAEWRRLKDNRGILLNAQKDGIRIV